MDLLLGRLPESKSYYIWCNTISTFIKRDVEELYEALSSNSNIDRSQWKKWNNSYLMCFMETVQ